MPIEHVRIILYETIKKYIIPKTKQNVNLYLPTNMLIYKFPKTMSFKYFIEQINYIFRKEHLNLQYGEDNTLNNETFFKILYKMTYMNKQEIENRLKQLLPDKYNNIVPKFTNIETFKYSNCIKNDELQHLLLSIPIILTTKYNYVSGTIKNNYYGYQNIDYIITNYNKYINEKYQIQSKKNSKSNINSINNIQIINDNFNIDNDDFLYLNLNYYNKTINNDYFILLYNYFKKIVDDGNTYYDIDDI